MKVGMIGIGRFGELIAGYLAQDCTLLVYDCVDRSSTIRKQGAIPATLHEVCQCPIIIALVPISSLEKLLLTVRDTIRPDALFIDGCSVKEYPIALMKQHLPPSVSLLGTHPMFGPDSAKGTLMGTKIVLCPERINQQLLQKIIAYLERNGIKTIINTAEQHDQQVSQSLTLTHFIGRAMLSLKMGPLEIDTKGYRRLIKILETVQNDSIELFQDMNRYNRFSGQTRKQFIQALEQIDQSLHP